MSEPSRVEIGEPAPEFTLPADGGREISLGQFRGKPVVLYLYPRDDTSGCTREALDFTERLPEFEAEGAAVLGLSKDNVASHDRFINKHGLKVTLLSDTSGETAQAYGAWVEKSMYGRKYMGIDRSTFLIDGEGVLRRIWRKVKVPGHVEEVLAALRELETAKSG
ncbi:MAG TPA: peroxiredoxin [Paracoccaceae bacterium]|nr:peroxiredoxin [Paracoccaceae bacterium]